MKRAVIIICIFLLTVFSFNVLNLKSVVHTDCWLIPRGKLFKQGGNSNLDCVPRTAVVAMSDGGGGGGGP